MITRGGDPVAPGGGAPAEVAPAVAAALDGLGVPHEVLACDPALADTEAFCAAYGVRPDESANTIVVVAKRGPAAAVACVLLATTHLDVNGAVRRRTGWPKASFAGADDTAALTGMELGGVTPFGLPESVPVLVDARVLGPERVVLGGGNRSSKLLVAPAALERLPAAAVVEGLAVERGA